MDCKLNYSPHLKMSDITKQLFNQNFQSDVQFSVDDKIIYAHSNELIKRSVVFEEQLAEPLVDNKLIFVADCKYEVFFEFIRFIYTDDCEISAANGIDILKLAIDYKVIKLVNNVLNNMKPSWEWTFKLFNYSAVNKSEILRCSIYDHVASNARLFIQHKLFLSLQHDAVDEFLKFEYFVNGVTEKQLFMTLGNWITEYCKIRQMPILEGREQFDNLIKKIRFPTISNEEIHECAKQFPELLSENDCTSIIEKNTSSDTDGEYDPWNSISRSEYIISDRYSRDVFNSDTIFETRLTVSQDTIFSGMRIGNFNLMGNEIQIGIFSNDGEKLSFILTSSTCSYDLTYNLGESLTVKSNLEYTIMIKYLKVPDSSMKVWCRKEGFGENIHSASKSVHIGLISRNVFDLFFKSPI